jgi:hypothetical protein
MFALSSRVLFGRPGFGYGLSFWVMISRFRGGGVVL